MSTFEIRALAAWPHPDTTERLSSATFRAPWDDTIRLLRDEADHLGAGDPIVLRDYMTHLWHLEADGERATVAVGPFSAVTLIGALQLAMRHPELSARQRDMLTQFIDQMRPLFAGTPGEELIRRGDDPAFDQ